MTKMTLCCKTFLISVLIYFINVSNAYSDQELLMGLSVEDLLNIEVISTAKKSKSINDSPAAIFVISQDDIKRIGATSIPEALRLAPGLDVARIDANKWAISARGFNGRFANKLLVLIDGRNVYTKAFAGVYWENQDVMLEDVERIEVIRGPGATLWGENAVNGVINIITKHSADTQGGLLVAGGGSKEQGFGALRYGTELNKETTGRVYLKGFKRDENTRDTDIGANDNWDKVQGGFRVDSQFTIKDSLTFQGDAYYNKISQHTALPQLFPPYKNEFNEQIDSFGGNLLMRQKHVISSYSNLDLQIYYDFYERNENFIEESRHAFDFDFQHRFAFLDRNDVVWGIGNRYNNDEFSINNTSIMAQVSPESRDDHLFSAFVQDEITLIEEHLWLTLGTKIEHNDFSGFEVQPTARIMWAPNYQHRLWAAISRAVRTPSRLEHDMSSIRSVTPPQLLSVPPFFAPSIAVRLEGDRGFDSEDVISYEMGYRTTVINDLSVDLTAFYNHYNNLRSGEFGDPQFNGSFVLLPLVVGNTNSAQTYGFEVSAVWQMMSWWRWDANYNLLISEFSSRVARQTGASPQQSISLRSIISPLENIDVDVLFRYVDTNSTINAFANTTINDYFSLDIRLAWKPVKQIELSLVGQNLLAEHHLEYVSELFTVPTEIDRGLYGKISWKF